MQRVKMPKGHVELSLGGVSYKIDETGAFEVPDEHASELVKVHGARYEPGLDHLQENVDAAENALAHAKAVVERLTTDLADAKNKLAKFQEQQKSVLDARMKADAEAKAKLEADTKTAAADAAKNNGKK